MKREFDAIRCVIAGMASSVVNSLIYGSTQTAVQGLLPLATTVAMIPLIYTYIERFEK